MQSGVSIETHQSHHLRRPLDPIGDPASTAKEVPNLILRSFLLGQSAGGRIEAGS